MSLAELYDASPINPRRRATREQMEERARFLIDYAAEQGPVTVRQLYYQAEVRGVPGIDKTEDGYNKIQKQVLDLRRAGRLAAEKDVGVSFNVLAIEQNDILEFDKSDATAVVNLYGQARWLPTRTPKRNSPADRNWPHPYAIELDAIEPDDLRRMVREVIERYLPPDQLEILKAAEKSERELIAGLVGKIASEGAP